MESVSRKIADGDCLRVRVAPVLMERVRVEAEARGVSVSEMIREAVIADLRRPLVIEGKLSAPMAGPPSTTKAGV